MADEQREHRAKKNIYAFLQRRSIEQRRSYLARGRRFVVLDVGQLSKSWITAVKNWLARKDRASEITMDDLTAELQLRGLTPPYDAVKQELATRFARMNEGTQKKAGREFARQVGMFVHESDKPLSLQCCCRTLLSSQLTSSLSMMHSASAAGANESTGAIERSHGALRGAATIALCRAAVENQHGCAISFALLGEELLPLQFGAAEYLTQEASPGCWFSLALP